MNSKNKTVFTAVITLAIVALIRFMVTRLPESPAAAQTVSTNFVPAATSAKTVASPPPAPAKSSAGSAAAVAQPGAEFATQDQILTAQLFVTQELDTAFLQYKIHMGHYPTGEDGLRAFLENTTGESSWHGPYIKEDSAPLDPWGHPYEYAYPSTHGQSDGRYDVWSDGPDGISGTADDIGNWPSP